VVSEESRPHCPIIDKIMKRKVVRFQNVLSNLGENITEEAYRGLITAYLCNFVKIAETGEM